MGFKVYGAIGAKWASLGGANGFLGEPTTDETGTPDGIGRYNHFRGGSIYWTAPTGAWEVHGAIRDKWAALGWERSLLRYPIEDETDMSGGTGRYSNFMGGTIVWTRETGAQMIYGEVSPKWMRERSWIGYPIEDEKVAPDGRGHFIHCQHGSIYWSPETGAHEVHGAIRDKWGQLHWERGALGYPTTDEFQDGDRRRSNFAGGFITWSNATGAVASVSLTGDVVLNPVDD